MPSRSSPREKHIEAADVFCRAYQLFITTYADSSLPNNTSKTAIFQY